MAVEHIYERIAKELEQRIIAGQYAPGEQMPIERELAKAFDVNLLTLRRALRVLDEKGIIRRERGKGTFIKSDASLARDNRILYLGDYTGHLFKDLYCCLAQEGQRQGKVIAAFDPNQGGGADQLRQLLRGNASIVCCNIPRNRFSSLCGGGLLAELESATPVFVNIAFTDISEGAYNIMSDYTSAASLATRHLIEMGHRKIAYMGPSPVSDSKGEFPSASPDFPQCKGYHCAMMEAGLDKTFSLGFYSGSNNSETVVDLLARYLKSMRGKFTGVICDMDYHSMHVYHAAKQAGISIPDELSVVGIGNTPWCDALSPMLTSVSLEVEEMARLSLLLCGHRPQQQAVIYLQPKLVNRKSVRDLR